MNSFQVVLEKIFMNNILLSEEITSAFPKLLGNCSWVLGQCTVQYSTVQSPHFRTPNPGFNPGFTPILYNKFGG
jgi:hypothetical protein